MDWVRFHLLLVRGLIHDGIYYLLFFLVLSVYLMDHVCYPVLF